MIWKKGLLFVQQSLYLFRNPGKIQSVDLTVVIPDQLDEILDVLGMIPIFIVGQV